LPRRFIPHRMGFETAIAHDFEGLFRAAMAAVR
jgi:hypothetical protein